MGGAAYLSGDYTYSSLFENCTFKYNGGGTGGTIYSAFTYPNFTGGKTQMNHLHNNKSKSNLGSMIAGQGVNWIYATNTSNIIIQSATLTCNSTLSGYVFCCQGDATSVPESQVCSMYYWLLYLVFVKYYFILNFVYKFNIIRLPFVWRPLCFCNQWVLL